MANKPPLTPIETVYKGYRFRSRLEARWAVFFDTLKIDWEYEKQGYALPSGPYLPDFWLPKYQLWIEIKGQEPRENEVKKCVELAEASGDGVCILAGPCSLETLNHVLGCGERSRGVAARVMAGRTLQQIGSAVNAACGARFEFGESGAAKHKPALVRRAARRIKRGGV